MPHLCARHISLILSASLLLLLLAGTSVWATPPAELASREHEVTLLVAPPLKPKTGENKESYKMRRDKTHDEILQRALSRYKQLGVRDLTGAISPSGEVSISMRSRFAPWLIQAVALNHGDLVVRPIHDQSHLWEPMLSPEVAQGALPRGIGLIDDLDEGIFLTSADHATLKKFVGQITLSGGDTLVIIPQPGKNQWRTLLLAAPVIASPQIQRVSLQKSLQTGLPFVEVQLTEQGARLWQHVTEQEEDRFAVVLDDEPLAQVRAARHELVAETSTHKSIAFSCHEGWLGAISMEECTALAAARAAGPLPMQLIPTSPPVASQLDAPKR